MEATVPAQLGGMRFDQVLVRLFPQYSRSRLQAWLASGHIRINGSPSMRLDYLGEHSAKNMERPLRVYQVADQ